MLVAVDMSGFRGTLNIRIGLEREADRLEQGGGAVPESGAKDTFEAF
jgi:hypothetical protein